MRTEQTTIRVDTETRNWLHILAETRNMSMATYLREVSNNARMDVPAPISSVEIWISEMERNLAAISLQLIAFRNTLEDYNRAGKKSVVLPHYKANLLGQGDAE